eukprot:5859006-Pyramimonas_sp.AAC.1
MARHDPAVAAALATWYRGPVAVDHYWRDAGGALHKVPSSRGFDQGDPLSPAGFSVAQREALADFWVELQRLDPAARLYSYLDDTYLVVEAGLSPATLTALETALEPYGLELNHAKTA